MHKKCAPHYHYMRLPSGRRIRTETDCFRNGFHEDEELGIAPALAALAPVAIQMGTDLIKDKMGGGGGGGGGAPAPAASGGFDTASILAAIQSADRGANTAEVRSIVRELLGTVPPPVRQQVQDALNQYKLQATDVRETMNKIVNDIGAKMSPALNDAIKMLADAQLQRSATNEHNVIVKNDKRWAGNTENQKKILQRLDVLERRLGTEIRARKGLTARAAAAFGLPTKLM